MNSLGHTSGHYCTPQTLTGQRLQLLVATGTQCALYTGRLRPARPGARKVGGKRVR